MERFAKSREIAENKLVILYALGKFRGAAANMHLTKYALEQRLMGYFALQQALYELEAQGYIAGEDGPWNDRLYRATPAGQALLQDMEGLLPRVEKNRIDRTMAGFRRFARDEMAVTATYAAEDEHRCVATLRIGEPGFPQIAIEIATGSKEGARAICANWKARPGEIYAGVVALLTGAALTPSAPAEQRGGDGRERGVERDEAGQVRGVERVERPLEPGPPPPVVEGDEDDAGERA
jgi:hypothetical protein